MVLISVIADAGGLLGLFVGCSIFSFFELGHFVVSKMSTFCAKVKKSKDENEQKCHVHVIDVK
jgi:hypothetical protein